MTIICERCRFMPWQPEHKPAVDRNGAPHHPYCVIIARDGLVRQILQIALVMGRLPPGDSALAARHRELRNAVRGYIDWRAERGLPLGDFEPQPLSREDRRRAWYEERGLDPDDYD